MKKEVFRIVRCYRKCFARLATKNPKESMYFWRLYRDKTEGLMDLFAADSNVSCEDYMLINRYLANQWQRLYNIYCK